VPARFEIDAGEAVEILVQRFAGILFQVRARDADNLLLTIDFDLERALLHHRQLVLRNLVTLGQVGIEIILAREHRARADRAPIAKPSLVAMRAASRFITGSTPGNARSTAHAWVFGSGAVLRGRSGEQLTLGEQLHVHFQTDNRFPFHQTNPFGACCASRSPAGTGAQHEQPRLVEIFSDQLQTDRTLVGAETRRDGHTRRPARFTEMV